MSSVARGDEHARVADHRKVPIPFPDAPRMHCQWCAEPIVYGRLDRRWHDGREDVRLGEGPRERDCKGEYLIAASADYAKQILSALRGPFCAQCGPPRVGQTQKLALRVADGRRFGSPFQWSDPWADVAWHERPRIATWNDPFAEMLDLVNPPRFAHSYSGRSPRVFAVQTIVVALEVDHVVPIIDGGSFELDNLQLLCQQCHRAKTATENRARAARRREEKRADTAQLALTGLTRRW